MDLAFARTPRISQIFESDKTQCAITQLRLICEREQTVVPAEHVATICNKNNVRSKRSKTHRIFSGGPIVDFSRW